MNRKNIGMIQGRRGARLLREAVHALRVGSEVGRQDFQSDSASELCVFREINFAHPARAEGAADLVATKKSSGSECHTCPVPIAQTPGRTNSITQRRKVKRSARQGSGAVSFLS